MQSWVKKRGKKIHCVETEMWLLCGKLDKMFCSIIFISGLNQMETETRYFSLSLITSCCAHLPFLALFNKPLSFVKGKNSRLVLNDLLSVYL